MNELVKKISLVSFGNVLNAVLGLMFLTAIAKALSVEEFGKYALLTTLLVAIAKITDFGTNSYFVATSITEDSNKKDVFLTLKVLLLGCAIVTGLIALHLLRLGSFTFILIFICGLCAYALNLTLFTFFQKEERFHLAVGINSAPALLKGVFALLVFGGVFRPTISSAFLIFSGSMISSMVFLKFMPDNFWQVKLSVNGWKNFLLKSIPAGIAIIINEGWSAIANSIMKLIKSFSDVGILSIADKIASIFSLLSFSIFTVLLPKNAKRKQDNQKYDMTETLFIAVVVLILALFTTVIGQKFIELLFGSKYSGSVNILGIMIFASAFTAIHTFIDNFFFVESKTTSIMFISLVKLFVFILVSFMLIPHYNLVGMAYAQLISALTATIITFFFVIKN